jgi:hypothetical protein
VLQTGSKARKPSTRPRFVFSVWWVLFRVVLPVRFGGCSTHFAGCESLGLHLHVHFRINIRRIERDMPQPGTNGVDVDPGTEQMGRSRVANSMRADALAG